MRETEIATTDHQYQTILTQRTIARAALHLGIDTLPQNTLTVLQDALTHYLERVGRVMGNNVEIGGRASDHVNVLDAIRAVEDCSLSAVGDGLFDAGIGSGIGNGNGIGIGNGSGHGAMNGIGNGHGVGVGVGVGHGGQDGGLGGNYGDWSDLARFLYGEAFFDSTDSNQVHSHDHAHAHAQQDGGDTDNTGWNAPLDDYDSIPLFPVHSIGPRAGTDSARNGATHDASLNPIGVDRARVLGNFMGIGMDDKNKDQTQSTTTDAKGGKVTSSGASAALSNAVSPAGANNTKNSLENAISEKEALGTKGKSTTKRKREEDTHDTLDKKRSKTSDATNGANADAKLESEIHNLGADADGEESTPLPSYIPHFLPPFPPKHTYTKSTRPVSTTVEAFQAQDVRSSLVQLGHSYWGQMTPSSTTGQESVLAKVQTGPVDVNGVNGGVGIQGAEVKAAVKPVGRASNARVSRILEGSLDVHS